ncbi:DNA repair protein RecO [Litoreibacter roseus]|uniref:DNA repair protein RecO n=1 Tax=Litoreibacter roseus TaxID=2601869 RepID=A0A6N6JLY7_9RHOB|nr:DNA repair protein RecO [Litoreibacter roseus]GFE66409.1 DNA repair protein RecO [Litoreibacter roseus]
MEWRSEGVLLAVRRHGENAAIIEVFTPDHGRHAGIVRGGTSRKLAPVMQPGAQLHVSWRARLEDHLGTFTIEPLKSRAAQVMDDRKALAGLNALCGLLSFALAERDPHPDLYDRTIALFDLLGANPHWPLAYLQWELALLEDMGFGLDLSSCAVSGTTQELTFVSPKSGRAVSSSAAGEWADRLLPLPACLRGVGDGSLDEMSEGLRTTGYFLKNWMAPQLGNKPLPPARQRLVDFFT